MTSSATAQNAAQLSLGLELGGGKSARTSLVVLKYFPAEKKVFLQEVHSQLQATREESGDEALLKLLNTFPAAETLAVHAPLSLAPCITCQLPVCPRFEQCTVPSVAWMREEAKRLKLTALKAPTPYTQRPVDLYLRGRVQKDLPIDVPLEETLGSGLAPLAARMQYLKRHLPQKKFLEVNPKISIAAIAQWFGISQRELRRYRDMEDGAQNRIFLLEAIARGSKNIDVPTLFLYNADTVLLAKDLDAFDAFITALMPIYQEAGLLRNYDPDYEGAWGTVALPALSEHLPSSGAQKQKQHEKTFFS